MGVGAVSVAASSASALSASSPWRAACCRIAAEPGPWHWRAASRYWRDTVSPVELAPIATLAALLTDRQTIRLSALAVVSLFLWKFMAQLPSHYSMT